MKTFKQHIQLVSERLQQLQDLDLMSDARRPRTYRQLDDLLADMRAKGQAKLLGAGVFSVAIQGTSGGQYVIKYTKDTADGWLHWGRYCQDNTSRHIPVVHRLYQFEDGGYYAVLNYLILDDYDRLKKALNVYQILENVRETNPDISGKYAFEKNKNIEQFLNSIKKGFQIEYQIDTKYFKWRELKQDTFVAQDIFTAFQDYWHVSRLFRDLAGIVSQSKTGIDMHSGNWAVDQKGNWVLNDPLSWITSG